MDYFSQLLELRQVDWLRIPLIQGFATTTSAVAGSRGLVHASRLALAQRVNANEEPLTQLLDDMRVVLNENMQDDRYAVPIMELAAFLLDSYVTSIPESSVSRSVHIPRTSIHKKAILY